MYSNASRKWKAMHLLQLCIAMHQNKRDEVNGTVCITKSITLIYFIFKKHFILKFVSRKKSSYGNIFLWKLANTFVCIVMRVTSNGVYVYIYIYNLYISHIKISYNKELWSADDFLIYWNVYKSILGAELCKIIIILIFYYQVNTLALFLTTWIKDINIKKLEINWTCQKSRVVVFWIDRWL